VVETSHTGGTGSPEDGALSSCVDDMTPHSTARSTTTVKPNPTGTASNLTASTHVLDVSVATTRTITIGEASELHSKFLIHCSIETKLETRDGDSH
jgi:hypothetical protein